MYTLELLESIYFFLFFGHLEVVGIYLIDSFYGPLVGALIRSCMELKIKLNYFYCWLRWQVLLALLSVADPMMVLASKLRGYLKKASKQEGIKASTCTLKLNLTKRFE